MRVETYNTDIKDDLQNISVDVNMGSKLTIKFQGLNFSLKKYNNFLGIEAIFIA